MVLHYSSGFILRFHYTGEYFAKLQARAWLSHALCSPGQHTAESLHDTTTFLFVTLLNIYRFYFLLADSAITFLNLVINNFTTP